MRINMNNMRRQRQDVLKKAFVVVLIIVLLSSCLCVGTLLAWLTQNIDRDSGDNITIGTVDFDVYYNNSLVTATKSNASGVSSSTQREISILPNTATTNSAIRSVNLKIRNTGTIDAIMRVTISIYQKDSNGNKVALVIADTPTADNSVAIQSDGWVRDLSGGVTSGYMYYNDTINPYTIRRITHNDDGTDSVTTQDVTANAVSVITQILVPTSMVNTTYYMSVVVEGIAYKGNIYQETKDKNDGKDYQIDVEAYPFGLPSTLPSGWKAWE